jgi:hypothetical protein
LMPFCQRMHESICPPTGTDHCMLKLIIASNGTETTPLCPPPPPPSPPHSASPLHSPPPVHVRAPRPKLVEFDTRSPRKLQRFREAFVPGGSVATQLQYIQQASETAPSAEELEALVAELDQVFTEQAEAAGMAVLPAAAATARETTLSAPAVERTCHAPQA